MTMNVKFMANIIRKEIITRNPEKADRVEKTISAESTYSSEASFTMASASGGKVEVTLSTDKSNDYTKFVTATLSFQQADGAGAKEQTYSYSYDRYDSGAFNRIVAGIKKDFKLDKPKA